MKNMLNVLHSSDRGLSLDSIQEELEDEPIQFKELITRVRSKRWEELEDEPLQISLYFYIFWFRHSFKVSMFSYT